MFNRSITSRELVLFSAFFLLPVLGKSAKDEDVEIKVTTKGGISFYEKGVLTGSIKKVRTGDPRRGRIETFHTVGLVPRRKDLFLARTTLSRPESNLAGYILGSVKTRSFVEIDTAQRGFQEQNDFITTEQFSSDGRYFVVINSFDSIDLYDLNVAQENLDTPDWALVEDEMPFLDISDGHLFRKELADDVIASVKLSELLEKDSNLLVRLLRKLLESSPIDRSLVETVRNIRFDANDSRIRIDFSTGDTIYWTPKELGCKGLL